MNIVPLSIGPNLVLSWLELFVPDVLKKTPDVFPLVAALLVEKIEYVEYKIVTQMKKCLSGNTRM